MLLIIVVISQYTERLEVMQKTMHKTIRYRLYPNRKKYEWTYIRFYLNTSGSEGVSLNSLALILFYIPLI